MLNEALVNYTLEKFGVEAKYKIIALPSNPWKELCEEKRRFDDLGRIIDKDLIQKRKELKQISQSEVRAMFEELLEHMQRLNRKIDKFVEKESSREYGEKLQFQDWMTSLAIAFIPMKEFIFLSALPKKHFPIHRQLLKEEVDFIILLNEDLLSKEKAKESQTAMAVIHETLHYIDFKKGKPIRTFENLEKRASKIIREYLQKYKKL